MKKVLILAALAAAASSTAVLGQGRGGGQQQPPASPRAAAPIDITGTWVSLVTDDWRWRMVTPPKGDILYLPVNAAGRKVAESWDPAADEAANQQCKGYGAPGLMIMPGRMRLSWQDDTTLKLEFDTGQQTRTLAFARGAQPSAAPSLQGRSIAEWEIAGRRGGAAPRTGALKVTTDSLTPGYFRKNGVPYGERAKLTEYYVLLSDRGVDYLALTLMLDDPDYLTGPYVRTVQFKKEGDSARWAPSGCTAR
jgi:hypothetical protein